MRSLNSLTLSCPHSFSVYPATFPVPVSLPLVLCHSGTQHIRKNNSTNEHVLIALYYPDADIQKYQMEGFEYILGAVKMSGRMTMAITNNWKI